jgi:hypothetical protein
MKTSKKRAEEQFAAIQRQAKRAQTEHEIAMQERADHIAMLRRLRLAKEAADREQAANASVTKTVNGKSPSR